jgi:hypothetical protein
MRELIHYWEQRKGIMPPSPATPSPKPITNYNKPFGHLHRELDIPQKAVLYQNVFNPFFPLVPPFLCVSMVFSFVAY